MALPINGLASDSEAETTLFDNHGVFRRADRRPNPQEFRLPTSNLQPCVKHPSEPYAIYRPACARPRRVDGKRFCKGQRVRLSVSDGRSPKRLRYSTEKRPI